MVELIISGSLQTLYYRKAGYPLAPLSLVEMLSAKGEADAVPVRADADVAVEELIARLGIQNRAFATTTYE